MSVVVQSGSYDINIPHNSNDNDCHGDKDDSNDIDFSNDGNVFGCCGDKNDVDVDADIVDD